MSDVFLAGYSDKLSVREGDKIQFYVSSYAKSNFTASVFRSICADPNPDGPGIIEEDASTFFPKTSYPSRIQDINPGSYARSVGKLQAQKFSALQIKSWFYPTLISEKPQILFNWGLLKIFVDQNGLLSVSSNNLELISSPFNLKTHVWYQLDFSVLADGELKLTISSEIKSCTGSVQSKIDVGLVEKLQSQNEFFQIAGCQENSGESFNGKIEAPKFIVNDDEIAAWNFEESIQSLHVKASIGPDLVLKNSPTRGVTGQKWNGTEFCWKHEPSHYAAIYFHEDDIYDFGWEADFELVIPQGMPSGAYFMRLEAEGHYDCIPFFVCAALGKPKADLCLLISTFTYTIYGNHARPDFSKDWVEKTEKWNAYPHNPSHFPHYGLSTYNNHLDGSGICHASNKRVLFNFRPGFLTFGSTDCSGLRHLQADSHLITWLHRKGIDYDIITDDELDRDGFHAIKNYQAIMTGSHPEYFTESMLNALLNYRESGGNLIYLGGNGFYWRIARHLEDPSLLEIRRAEDGIRAWASEPGEYYNAFDGKYGGLWRRNARPPQKLVGVGFTAQGNFVGMPYKRTCFDKKLDWVFEGVHEKILGDFGLSGGGAAGFELDRVDSKLGGDQDITILAQSFDLDGKFMLVPEEQLTHLTNVSGEPEINIKRADMVYFQVPGGGSVFSVGSITFCGSLPHNKFSNNISKILENVVKKFCAVKLKEEKIGV